MRVGSWVGGGRHGYTQVERMRVRVREREG